MTAIGYLALAVHYYIFFKTGLQGSCVNVSVNTNGFHACEADVFNTLLQGALVHSVLPNLKKSFVTLYVFTVTFAQFNVNPNAMI